MFTKKCLRHGTHWFEDRQCPLCAGEEYEARFHLAHTQPQGKKLTAEEIEDIIWKFIPTHRPFEGDVKGIAQAIAKAQEEL